MSSKKIEKVVIIVLLLLLFAVISSVIYKNYYKYKDKAQVSKYAFSYVEILGEKVKLTDEVRSYEVDRNCAGIEENTSIINYRMTETKEDFKVNVTSISYREDKILKENINEATNIDYTLSITDPNNTYEQIYRFKIKCKDNILELEQQKQEELQKQQKKSSKRK
jgi:hypothetical protein